MSENINKKDRIITIVIVIVVIILLGFNIFSYFGAAIVLPGKNIPYISGNSPTNNSISTIDVSSGKSIVNFWATWCSACIQEMPEINKISQKYRVYGVLKKPFKKDVFAALKPGFPNIIADDSFFEENYISVLPTSVFVENGVIKKVHTGILTFEIADEWFLQSDD